MESLFLDLKRILEEEKETLKQLSDTARKHNRALRQFDMDALKAAVRREEEAAALLRRQEETRRIIASELAGKLGLPQDATLRAYVDKAAPDLKGELADLLDSMAGIARDLAETNEINGLLARQALRASEILMTALGYREKQTYTHNGRIAGDDRPLLLLDKQV